MLKPEDEQLLKRQKELQARIDRNKFEFKPIAEFLCRHHGVSDVWQITPFGRRTHTWEVMRKKVVGIETKLTEATFLFADPSASPDAVSVFEEQQAIACPVATRATLLDNPTVTDPFCNPVTGRPLEYDLDRVCVYNFVSRKVKSTLPMNVAGRLNFYHKGIDAMYQLQQKDELIAKAGGVKGAFVSIPYCPDGEDIECVPIPSHGFMCTNEDFTMCMALVNERNIMNGIVVIPHDVCVAAKLRVWTGPPEPSEAFLVSALESLSMKDGHTKRVLSQEEQAEARARFSEQYKQKFAEAAADKKKSTHFLAIPINHLMAWPLTSEEFANQHGYDYVQFRFNPPAGANLPTGDEPIVLYFLIGNAYFDILLEQFKKHWLNMVDMRPLSSIAVEYVPQLDRNRYKGVRPDASGVRGDLSMTSYMTYAVPPKLSQATIDNLAPAMTLNFPSCSNWSPDEIARQMAIERYQEKVINSKKA